MIKNVYRGWMKFTQFTFLYGAEPHGPVMVSGVGEVVSFAVRL